MIPFDTEEDAIALANDTDYGLAAFLQTGDRRARRAGGGPAARGQRSRSTATAPGYGSPFGGYKQSGNGREGGVFGLEDFQEMKVRGALM